MTGSRGNCRSGLWSGTGCGDPGVSELMGSGRDAVGLFHAMLSAMAARFGCRSSETGVRLLLGNVDVALLGHAPLRYIHQSAFTLILDDACVDGSSDTSVVDRRHTDGRLLRFSLADGAVEDELLLKFGIASD
jgi:hypothetical protein